MWKINTAPNSRLKSEECGASKDLQVVIPREVRKQLQLKVGQKLKVIVKGQTINLVPDIPLSEMRGFLKGMDKSGLREEDERL